jgi:peptide/nickel transport system substrate-binding protein
MGRSDRCQVAAGRQYTGGRLRFRAPGGPGLRARLLLWLLVTVLATSCVSVAPEQSTSRTPEEGVPAARKVLVVGEQQEPITIQGFVPPGSSGSRGNTETNFLHALLVVQDADEVLHPQLAVEVPSVVNGTWRVNPDASMELTWRLRPGVQWHDGTPFTSADLLFAFQAYKDPEMAHPYASQLRLMDAAEAPDATTLVVRWRAVSVEADQALGLAPLPRHLLEETYRADKDSFVNSPIFGDEFMGLGPYRLAHWEHGSHMELTRFDNYFMGPPPLDGLIVRFIGDPNTMAANILAGTIDVVLPPSLDLDTALDVQRRWAGTGNQVRVGPLTSFMDLDLQYRPQLARPPNGTTNSLVRRALFQAIDRQGLADVMTNGAAPVADSWFRPGTPQRGPVEGSIPRYPHDPTAARRLLAEAGWIAASDGAVVSAATSEPFALELWSNTRAITKGEKQITLIGQDWKAVGVQVDLAPIPIARAGDRQNEASFPAALLSRAPSGTVYSRLDSTLIAGPANNWSGRNIGGYANPRVDAILRSLEVTVDARDRQALDRQLLQEVMGDIAWMPLYWEVRPVLMLASVQAEIQANNPSWNAFDWRKL